MKVTKGDKSYDIPSWALFVGLLVVDNVVANVCKVWSYKKYTDAVVKVSEEDEES